MDISKNKLMIGFVVGACIGLLIFLIGSFYSVKVIFFDIKGKTKTYGEIINITDSSTTVKYSAYGRSYKKVFNVYSSTYYEGKNIKIYYDKDHPQKAMIANMRYLVLIAPGMGILITGLFGVGLLFIYIKSDTYKLKGY